MDCCACCQDHHPLNQNNWLQVVGFYEYYEGLQEGWDGPALLVFSDGEHVGARLDRNGLRPARFWVTSDDMVYVASEVLAFPLPIDTPELHLLEGGARCTPVSQASLLWTRAGSCMLAR